MEGLNCRDITVRFGDRLVLDRVSLRVGPQEIVGLIGPSGSGKSTMLRVIAGLLTPDAGTVEWNVDDLASTPTHRRGFGYVFQDQQLFAHLDVVGNVGFGLKMAGTPKTEIAARVTELLAMVELGGFERRSVVDLSGGEAQRVALARALAPRPKLLLLDEPLSALDKDLREQLGADVRRLLKDLGTPAIHVTHDADEAAQICDTVIRLA
jgi:thiamine transport system ATP-binding protein